MEQEISKIIDKVSQIRLSHEEKNDVGFSIRAFMNSNPLRRRQSYSAFFLRNWAAFSAAFVMLLFLTTSYVSEYALPGDPHYWFKTRVNESVVDVLSFTKEGKAHSNIVFTERRLEEIHSLIEKNIINTDEIEEIRKEVEQRSNEVSQYVDSAEDGGRVGDSIEAAVRFNLLLEIHENKFESDKEVARAGDESLKKVEEVVHTQRVKIDSYLKGLLEDKSNDDPDKQVIEDVRKSRAEAKEFVEEVVLWKDFNEKIILHVKDLMKKADADVQNGNYLSAYIRYEQILAIRNENKSLKNDPDIHFTDDIGEYVTEYDTQK